MYAIIKTGGKQYRVSEGDFIDIEHVEGEGEITFDEVLFFNDGMEAYVGNPHVSGCVVTGEIQGEILGPKVTSVTYKKRKNQRRKFGHRQGYSRIKITHVGQKGKQTNEATG